MALPIKKVETIRNIDKISITLNKQLTQLTIVAVVLTLGSDQDYIGH